MKFKIALIFLSIGALLLIAAYGILNYSYSTGVRSGKLVKISKKGFIYPTYEGTLDLGSGDKLTWQFSVHDDQLGEELSKYSGKEVKLSYQEIFFRLVYETKYNITSYKLLTKNAEDSDQRFCRLVNILRRSPKLVSVSKKFILKHDPELLTLIRSCQK